MKNESKIKIGKTVKDVLYHGKIENLREKDKKELETLIDEIRKNGDTKYQLYKIDYILKRYGFSVRKIVKSGGTTVIIFYDESKNPGTKPRQKFLF